MSSVRLKLRMRAVAYGPIAIRSPRVTVRLELPRGWSPSLRALVDSGSPLNLLSRGAAEKFAEELGLDLSGPELFPIVGLGGRTDRPIECRVLLEFAHDPPRPPRLRLPDARVYVTRLPLPDGLDVLLGQRDALERLEYVQRNQDSNPEFVLLEPSLDRTVSG